MFIKNLQAELTAFKMWEFTDKVRQSIQRTFELNGSIKSDRPFWCSQAEPVLKGFKNNPYQIYTAKTGGKLVSRSIVERFKHKK